MSPARLCHPHLPQKLFSSFPWGADFQPNCGNPGQPLPPSLVLSFPTCRMGTRSAAAPAPSSGSAVRGERRREGALGGHVTPPPRTAAVAASAERVRAELQRPPRAPECRAQDTPGPGPRVSAPCPGCDPAEGRSLASGVPCSPPPGPRWGKPGGRLGGRASEDPGPGSARGGAARLTQPQASGRPRPSWLGPPPVGIGPGRRRGARVPPPGWVGGWGVQFSAVQEEGLLGQRRGGGVRQTASGEGLRALHPHFQGEEL